MRTRRKLRIIEDNDATYGLGFMYYGEIEFIDLHKNNFCGIVPLVGDTIVFGHAGKASLLNYFSLNGKVLFRYGWKHFGE